MFSSSSGGQLEPPPERGNRKAPMGRARERREPSARLRYASPGRSLTVDSRKKIYMCGCSPVCKSFFDTHRAAGSFLHVSGLCMRHILIAGRNGVLCSGSGTQPRTRFGPVQKYGFPEADHAIGCSIRGLGTPRYPPRTRRPRRIQFQAACPAWIASFPWFSFLLLAAMPHVRCRLFRRRAYGSAKCPLAPSG